MIMLTLGWLASILYSKIKRRALFLKVIDHEIVEVALAHVVYYGKDNKLHVKVD